MENANNFEHLEDCRDYCVDHPCHLVAVSDEFCTAKEFLETDDYFLMSGTSPVIKSAWQNEHDCADWRKNSDGWVCEGDGVEYDDVNNCQRQDVRRELVGSVLGLFEDT
eukprot:UN00429